MKPQDIIKAIAELDGYEFYLADKDVTGFSYRWVFQCPKERLGNQCLSQGNVDDGIRSLNDLPAYLNSRDAIIPVIEKICNPSQQIKVKFLNYLRDVVKRIPDEKVSDYNLVCATPEQLCEALLRATGK